jgi:hypothetical protein
MKIESGRAVVFIVVLGVIGTVIHNALQYNAPRSSAVAPVTAVQTPAIPIASPVAAPVVSISKIWPDGATPTKIVHIPDPQEPAKGLLEINLHQGDDLELDFDPLWTIRTTREAEVAGEEVAIDSGNGFETLQEFAQTRETSGTNAWWMKSRKVRMRLAAGHPDMTCDYTVEKKSPESPLPTVPPQMIGDLSVTCDVVRWLPDRKVLAYLTFRNNSTANTIAVALHDESCTMMPCELATSLLCSDGTPYVLYTSELTGINGLRTSPRYLTAIEPGQELKTSLKFEPRGNVSSAIDSVRLQSEIVVNADYLADEYSNFRETGRDFLPPNCMVFNVMFDIPIRHHD